MNEQLLLRGQLPPERISIPCPRQASQRSLQSSWRDEMGTDVLLAAIGREIRVHRMHHGMSLADLAAAANISTGMLSKVENGQISPSLDTLQALSNALARPLVALFRNIERRASPIFWKEAEEDAASVRNGRTGSAQTLSRHKRLARQLISEQRIITLSKPGDAYAPVPRDGTGFLYVLEGEITYRHNHRLHHMREGDSLLFDSDARHGAHDLTNLPVRLLTVNNYFV